MHAKDTLGPNDSCKPGHGINNELYDSEAH